MGTIVHFLPMVRIYFVFFEQFVVGQTGSGKTYTMMGKADDNEQGIIPRLSKDILDAFQPTRNSNVQKADITVSFFEIYNEKIYDLLSATPGSVCRVREHPEQGVYVENLTQRRITAYSHVENVLVEGHSKRQVAPTLMNAESSRSHAIFTISLLQIVLLEDSGVTTVRNSRVCLVDLAGSERVQSTGASGNRLKEATNINKSLSVLGDVINALSEASTAKDKFIPYRNSALTYVLKDSLGGNSKTTMLATISPTAVAYNESINTLRYIERAKLIMKHVMVNNISNDGDCISQLQHQINHYKIKQSQMLSHFESRELEFQEKMAQLHSDYEARLQQIRQPSDMCIIYSEAQQQLQIRDETIKQLNIQLERAKSDIFRKNQEIGMLNSELELRSMESYQCQNSLRLHTQCGNNAHCSVARHQNDAISQLSALLTAKTEDYDDLLEKMDAMEKFYCAEMQKNEEKLSKSDSNVAALAHKLTLLEMDLRSIASGVNVQNDKLSYSCNLIEIEKANLPAITGEMWDNDSDLIAEKCTNLIRVIECELMQIRDVYFSRIEQQATHIVALEREKVGLLEQLEKLKYFSSSQEVCHVADIGRLTKRLQDKESAIDIIVRMSEERELNNLTLRRELECISSSFHNLQCECSSMQTSLKEESQVYCKEVNQLVKQLELLELGLALLHKEMRTENDMHKEEKHVLSEEVVRRVAEIKVLRKIEADLKKLLTRQNNELEILLKQVAERDAMCTKLRAVISEEEQKNRIMCDAIAELTLKYDASLEDDMRDQLLLTESSRDRLQTELSSFETFDHDAEGISQVECIHNI